jgi:hypothetical protein
MLLLIEQKPQRSAKSNYMDAVCAQWSGPIPMKKGYYFAWLANI